MDTTNNQSVTDDQELAKVLENMNQDINSGVPPVPTDLPDPTMQDPNAQDSAVIDQSLSFEETQPVETPAVEPAAAAEPVVEAPVESVTAPSEPIVATPVTSSPELDSIKKSALEELRPLVDKLDLPADEKFDTLLLLIRSTDDRTLVSAAHDAAKAIPDETKRAQALLDVIKEIDYFSGHGQNPA